MEQDFRNQADGFAGAAESADTSAPAGNRQPVVRFCAWCKEICVRPKAMRFEDALLIYLHGGERKAFWNGRELLVGDGICEKCRAEQFPESMSRASSAQVEGKMP